MNAKAAFTLLTSLSLTDASLCAREFHVSVQGDDTNRGSRAAPFRTIQHAAELAQPGDTITVHRGVYRERVSPPRGGESESRRIVYRAAPGEQVVITGAEIVRNWVKVQENVWQVKLPNTYFGNFNPYGDLIHGDWFNPKGREHHTGAVYLNGEWLTEAARLEELLEASITPSTLSQQDPQYLLNVSWLRPSPALGKARQIAAQGFTAQQGVQTAPCSEGGECIGWIEPGDWVRYDNVDFGGGTDQMEIRAAAATEGGVIEIHLNSPEGDLLGTCAVSSTGDWQSWQSFSARLKPVSGIKSVCLVFKSLQNDSARSTARQPALWFGQVDPVQTTIWAQFKGVDPNEQLVEINVRRTVFYPEHPGINYLTVRGFTLRQAATPWAPPTAEQVGLIGTHWSKGWIIENNTISHSVCSGIALGKYGDQWDNTSADTAEGYVKTIERALENGWSQDTIGHHVVRNNTIAHCEQAGIVGSLGAAFSTVSGNDIHDIHVRRRFTGAEMAGIKFHAAIDTVIRSNHIYRTCRGLWLDWMAQGTRVSGNLFHENASEDLFVEVNHGPFVVDNNLFLSPTSVLDMSEGGAYAHNLFCGKIISRPELSRETPYHSAHTTAVAGLVKIQGGDDRFYNNLFIGPGEPTPGVKLPGKPALAATGYGTRVYENRSRPVFVDGNAYASGARPYSEEGTGLQLSVAISKPVLREREGKVSLELSLQEELRHSRTQLVTTRLLGETAVGKLPYENHDGSSLVLDRDYFGRKRNARHPMPGPFEIHRSGALRLRVW